MAAPLYLWITFVPLIFQDFRETSLVVDGSTSVPWAIIIAILLQVPEERYPRGGGWLKLYSFGLPLFKICSRF
jgi:hypothetical protein